MELSEVLEYFKSANALCEALNIAPQNCTVWKKKNRIPMVNQLKIQEITKGKLKANMDLLNKPNSRKSMKKELEELRAYKLAHEKDSRANE